MYNTVPLILEHY